MSANSPKSLFIMFLLGVFFSVHARWTASGRDASRSNDRPIIGILALDKQSPLAKTIIPATYVKYLEQAGARVVPIRGGQPDEYYSKMVNYTNGILIPGGAVSLWGSLIGRSARLVYSQALTLNQQGDFFPLWGTCMGFQMLCYLALRTDPLLPTNSENVSWPLDFSPGYKQSRMFSGAPVDIINILSTQPVTQNEHHLGVWTSTFESSSLSKFYKKLSTNKDRDGTEFVSTIEAKDFPFYGVQWHPEKANFNWNPHYVINHGADAVKVSQYMADFFVSEARKSSHRFPSVHLEAVNLIENYKHHYSDDGTFSDIYLIDNW